MYELWYKQLPRMKSVLRLKDLYLPLWLHDFGLADTRDYLSQLSEQSQQVFLDDTLIEAIHHTTNGHPLYLALIASAISEMQTRGQDPKLDELEQALVPPGSGHEDETIRDYLLSLFLGQLPKREKHELVFCAVPRALDIGTLRAVLQLPSDIEAHERWNRYRHFTFARLIDDERIVFHPILRTLLLQGLVPDYRPESDYYRAHARLREHFRRYSRNGDEQAQIEEAYHALALGDPEPAITLALTILINVTALILYRWLGSASPGDTGKTTSISGNPVRSRKGARQ